jgi:hypothetical protein
MKMNWHKEDLIMIQIALDDKSAIMLYKLVLAANQIRPDITMTVVQKKLEYQLAPLEMEAYKQKEGYIKCFHCGYLYSNSYELICHVKLAVNGGLKEAVDITRAWYKPNLILNK